MRENAFAPVDFVKRVVSHSSRHELCRIIRHLESAIAMQRLHAVPKGCVLPWARGSYRVSWRVMKRRQRNQHDRSFLQRFLLRQTAGQCPVCTGQLGKKAEPAVIYGRSSHSVTFRCKTCDLRWTITWASLHRAASTFAAALREAGVATDDVRVKQYDFVANGTKFAVEREAKRKSTFTRQKNRRVIRLPDSAA